MKRSVSRWRKALLARFGDREDIGIDEVYEQYFAKDQLPKEGVLECLKLIEFEYELPAGLVRPSDKLEKLLTPVRASNPWLWLFYRSREEDSESELNYQLSKQLRKHGTFNEWQEFETMGDLVHAWCGRSPTNAKGGQRQS